ncbi:GlsB/YeaQ/YmgE family stress response membrane protein [Chryseobacterium indoltheticum]|uniref:GlsB/YeaQ/YmgE family stress response membrane protein n=1 Tax=Chryseobacterium indoltheticum TaxID=254 RepID=UPI003F497173
MWTFILWIIFGLIVGAIAKMIMPGKQNMGWLTASILGIVGAFVGGFIANTIFGGGGANDDRMFHFWPLVFSSRWCSCCSLDLRNVDKEKIKTFR